MSTCNKNSFRFHEAIAVNRVTLVRFKGSDATGWPQRFPSFLNPNTNSYFNPRGRNTILIGILALEQSQRCHSCVKCQSASKNEVNKSFSVETYSPNVFYWNFRIGKNNVGDTDTLTYFSDPRILKINNLAHPGELVNEPCMYFLGQGQRWVKLFLLLLFLHFCRECRLYVLKLITLT